MPDVDMSDVEAIETLLESHGWHLLERRMLNLVERLRHSLEGDLSEGESQKTRGSIFAYRVILELPKLMKSEITAEVKANA